MRGMLALCVILLFSTIAKAGDIYVDNLTGDDRRTGYMLTSDGVGNGPVRSITKALRLANKGDRIILVNNEGRPYRESIAISGGFHSGIATYPFTLIGN